MSKKILFALFLLVLAAPVLALPPQCDCIYCFSHGSSSCTLVPGNTVTTCGAFYPTHCEGPSGPSAASAAPSRIEFLAELAAPVPAAPQVCGVR